MRAALEPWRARPGPAASERTRLFRDAIPEWIFRGHPILPFMIVTPAIGLWLERYVEAPTLGLAASLAVFALGWLVWSLVEYAMHRFLFHFPARGPAGLVATFIVHGHHHVSPREPSRLAATPVQLISMSLLLGGLWHAALGPTTWMIAMAGTMTGYLAYEAVHHVAHHESAQGRFLGAVARHHLAHHYESPSARWGISSPLWDWVFRTSR